MAHSGSEGTNTNLADIAFIFRMTWDVDAEQWRILVKPANGDESRLFCDLESAFLYVESQMTLPLLPQPERQQ